MLFLKRHLLSQHLMELPGVVDRYAARDAGFVDAGLEWLATVERTLLELRHQLAGGVAASRSEILAARDGYRRQEADSGSSSAGPRQVQRATAAAALSRVEKLLREVVDTIDRQLEGHRERMVQLLAVASTAEPVPARDGRPREEWLHTVWSKAAGVKEAAGMHAYLNASLPRSDVLTLLGEVLDNLLAEAAEASPPARTAGRLP